jgi:hypothetical protein
MTVASLRRVAARARRRRRPPGEPVVFGGLLALASALAVGSVFWPNELRAAVVLSVPLLLGGLLLHRRLEMWLLLAATALLLLAALVAVEPERRGLNTGSALLVGVVTAVSYELVRRRDLVGLRESRPDTVLRELRQRLLVQGTPPELPAGWRIETELRSAHDSGMAGDFIVSRMDTGSGCLDVALVDVSGKGVSAGTRALLLSGAFGGLLGSVPPERFLVEANRYLLRQRWPEGFATAVYLRVDLATGEFRVETAGHPPAAHLDAGSGSWRLTSARGPLLGVLPAVRPVPHLGVLRPGDALLLYTDGVVEDRGRDVDLGLDRLLGAAESLIPRGDFTGGAAYLVERVPARADDDRAIVLLWREPRRAPYAPPGRPYPPA